jgi:MtN3 and saliva related transmembrane protein
LIVMPLRTARSLVYGAMGLAALMFCGCEGVAIHDPRSLLAPTLQRSEIFGFLAGLGPTVAALPDLVRMVRRRSSAGLNPTMAGITGSFQLLWIYYGLLIGSRPVIAWNVLGALINLVTVAAYVRIASGQQREVAGR